MIQCLIYPPFEHLYSRSTSVFSELIMMVNHSDYYHFRCTFVFCNGILSRNELCSVYFIGVEVIRMSIIKTKSCLFDCLVVFNATFNNISVISWRLVLFVECFFLNSKQVKICRQLNFSMSYYTIEPNVFSITMFNWRYHTRLRIIYCGLFLFFLFYYLFCIYKKVCQRCTSYEQ